MFQITIQFKKFPDWVVPFEHRIGFPQYPQWLKIISAKLPRRTSYPRCSMYGICIYLHVGDFEGKC